MSSDFKVYLATELISDQKTVSYRHVSRHLKVHVNAAKCMLYEFYTKENKKKPSSVYATYLIAGTKKVSFEPNLSKDTDDHNTLPSSPHGLQSSMPAASQATEVDEQLQARVKTKHITLAREELLEQAKQQYDEITSIHIYSLSPARIQDLQSLTDVSRSIFTEYHSKQDPLIHNKDYGIIQNPHVRRRQGKRPTGIDLSVTAPAAKIQAVKSEVKQGLKPASAIRKEEAKISGNGEDTASRPSSRDSTSTVTEGKKVPGLKHESSSLFRAFAKQKEKPTLKKQDTTASSVSKDTDLKMEEESLGESEDEALFLDTNTKKPAVSKKRAADVQKEKEEKRKKLRRMMEDDADAENEVPSVDETTANTAEPTTAKAGKGDDETAPAGDEQKEKDTVAWSDSDADEETNDDKASHKTNSQTTDALSQDPTLMSLAPKRKRGKRKIMKKRTMKDEDGYLVTREEEAWESFSEDEPEVSKPVLAGKSKQAGSTGGSGSAPSSQAKQKSGTNKSSAKTGTGTSGKKDIMSFFGKR